MLSLQQSISSRAAAVTGGRRACVTTASLRQPSAGFNSAGYQLDEHSKPSTSTWASAVSAAFLAVALTAAPLNLVFTSPAAAKEDSQEFIERAVTEYGDLETKGKLTNSKVLDDFRGKFGIKRNVDGRVMLRSSKGEWFNLRLDMEVPGSMLLRDSKGQVYAIQTDSLQQIDLSDDLVVLMMFADREWEQQMIPVQYADEKGETKTLKLNDKEFREVVGLLKEIEEQGEDDGDDNQ